LQPIEGNVPDATNFPTGCRFHPRCRFRLPRCSEALPDLVARKVVGGGAVPHLSSCFYRDEHAGADFLDDKLFGTIPPEAAR
jgi:peptide/nickel transport system ATP-binding protein